MNQSNEMPSMEMEALARTINGMPEEQLRFIVKHIPVKIMCDEVTERYELLADKLNGINNIMGTLS